MWLYSLDLCFLWYSYCFWIPIYPLQYIWRAWDRFAYTLHDLRHGNRVIRGFQHSHLNLPAHFLIRPPLQPLHQSHLQLQFLLPYNFVIHLLHLVLLLYPLHQNQLIFLKSHHQYFLHPKGLFTTNVISSTRKIITSTSLSITCLIPYCTSSLFYHLLYDLLSHQYILHHHHQSPFPYN